ncbi:MAG: hypothetical protein HY692_09675 [Cyanobacteria bacterium NC_groundwater_1444_Ag_S-0.65um_54_12]|nr:hypothetical protein [Cyanobacteria bacterium NC_groundwater_1444_Ag_S-0.65um_54_12]
MGTQASLRQQIPRLARAIYSIESLLASAGGHRATLLQDDLANFRRRLVNIDEALWETPFYPCHCGRRFSQCPNRVGEMVCNLADKGA